jgi:hypothetical protein
MTESNQKNETDPSKTTSSMNISTKVICEGEACIGEAAAAANAMPPETGTKEDGSATGSSMGISGEEVCSGEACIGKK